MGNNTDCFKLDWIEYLLQALCWDFAKNDIRRRHVIKWETFSSLLTICAGISPVTGDFPAQRPIRRSFGVFFDLHPNNRLNKQWWGWWFETPSRPSWRHCNVFLVFLPRINYLGVYVCVFQDAYHNKLSICMDSFTKWCMATHICHIRNNGLNYYWFR